MSSVTRWWWIRHAPTAVESGRIYGRTDLAADLSDTASIESVAARLPAGATWLTSDLRRSRETAAALIGAMESWRQAHGARPPPPCPSPSRGEGTLHDRRNSPSPLEGEGRGEGEEVNESVAPLVPPLQPDIEPDLAEQDFGAWQGRRWDDLRTEDPAAQDAFWADPTGSAPPGGESFADVIVRVAATIERRTGGSTDRDIVAVAHGGPIRAAVALALDLSPTSAMALAIDNLSLTRIDHVADGLLRGHGGVWRVAGVNLPARTD